MMFTLNLHYETKTCNFGLCESCNTTLTIRCAKVLHTLPDYGWDRLSIVVLLDELQRDPKLLGGEGGVYRDIRHCGACTAQSTVFSHQSFIVPGTNTYITYIKSTNNTFLSTKHQIRRFYNF